MYNISMIIDIVIAAVIFIGIITGLVRGFIKTVFGFFHSIASGVAELKSAYTGTNVIFIIPHCGPLCNKLKISFWFSKYGCICAAGKT